MQILIDSTVMVPLMDSSQHLYSPEMTKNLLILQNIPFLLLLP